MSTVIRPEISKKNEYWISKHRYYELKHYCLQYPEWKRICRHLQMECIPKCISASEVKLSGMDSKTEKLAMLLNEFQGRMKVIEDIAIAVDPQLYRYILLSVTEGCSFANLETIYQIPCSKDTFYDRYRKFFWSLSATRN